MKIGNLTKSQKIGNLTKSGFCDLTCSTATQNLPKPPNDLKIVLICSGWSMVNLLVYGTLFRVLNCDVAKFALENSEGRQPHSQTTSHSGR